jgi:geranylgeranyl pyrophosphate synthase
MIELKLNRYAKKVDNFLLNFLKRQSKSLLVSPMKYGAISGGKKIRSTIIFDTGKIFGLREKKLLNICAAVECIRRGKPAAHIKFGEATAVLAGNSLLTLAFEIISDKKNLLTLKQKNEIITLLSNCAGHTGIAGGQELDLKFENKKKSFNQIIDMQRKKTGKLFNFCLQSAAIVANKNIKVKLAYGEIGEDIGLLFQLSDDFLDVKGLKKLVGKPIKKDRKKGKSTLVSLMGYEKTLRYANNLKKKILLKLKKHGKVAKDLTETIEFIQKRNF